MFGKPSLQHSPATNYFTLPFMLPFFTLEPDDFQHIVVFYKNIKSFGSQMYLMDIYLISTS